MRSCERARETESGERVDCSGRRAATGGGRRWEDVDGGRTQRERELRETGSGLERERERRGDLS